MASPPPRNAAPIIPDEFAKPKRLNKEPDEKHAQVTFPKDFSFTFPDVTWDHEENVDRITETTEELAKTKEEFKKTVGRHAQLNRRGAPNFFGL